MYVCAVYNIIQCRLLCTIIIYNYITRYKIIKLIIIITLYRYIPLRGFPMFIVSCNKLNKVCKFYNYIMT